MNNNKLEYINYPPFGMVMPGRSYSSGDYWFGFQNQEQDSEVKGNGNAINFKFRVHDPRIGRFLSLDPLSPDYPHNSPYAFSENRVIDGVDLEGLEFWKYTEMDVYNPDKMVIEVVTEKELVDPIQPFKVEYTRKTPFNHPIVESTRTFTSTEKLKDETGIVETIDTKTLKSTLEKEDKLSDEQKSWRFITLPLIEIRPDDSGEDIMRKIEEVDPGATEGGEHHNQNKIDYEEEMPD